MEWNKDNEIRLEQKLFYEREKKNNEKKDDEYMIRDR